MAVQMTRDAAAEYGDGGVRVVLDGVFGEGKLSVVEVVMGERFAFPFHIHHREDEIVFVLEGEVVARLDGEESVLAAGEAMFLPRGKEHSLAPKAGRARVSCTFSPAGFEEFLLEADGMSIERLIAAAARYGCDITGEPPRAGDGFGGRR